jgi:hypothetical protein
VAIQPPPSHVDSDSMPSPALKIPAFALSHAWLVNELFTQHVKKTPMVNTTLITHLCCWRGEARDEMKKPMANNHIYLLHAFGFFLEICRDGISLREKGGHFSFLFFSWLGLARLVLMPLLFTLLLYYFDPFCVAHLAMSNTKTCCFSLMYWRA